MTSECLNVFRGLGDESLSAKIFCFALKAIRGLIMTKSVIKHPAIVQHLAKREMQ